MSTKGVIYGSCINKQSVNDYNVLCVYMNDDHHVKYMYTYMYSNYQRAGYKEQVMHLHSNFNEFASLAIKVLTLLSA